MTASDTRESWVHVSFPPPFYTDFLLSISTLGCTAFVLPPNLAPILNLHGHLFTF